MHYINRLLNTILISLFLILFFIKFTNISYSQSCTYQDCTATSCHPSLCTFIGASCTTKPCTCGTSFSYDVKWCGRLPTYGLDCYDETTCKTKLVEQCSIKCTGGGNPPQPVLNPDKVSAGTCNYVCKLVPKTTCTTKEVCDSIIIDNSCVLQTTRTTQLCGTTTTPPPPTVPTCTAEESCIPTCPSGTVNYNTGLAAPSSSCSYKTGAVNGNGTCTQNTNTVNCWYPIPSTPPVVTVTYPNTASALGCTASTGYIGTESNNLTTYDFVFDDPDTLNPNEALMVWFSNVDTTSIVSSINKIYESGTPRSNTNSQYGFLVRKEATGWNSIYVPSYNGSSTSWVKAGTIGSGLRAEIFGTNGKKMVGVRDLSVSTASLKNTLRFSLQFYNETSGLADYEKVTDNSYAIYGAANRRSTFLPSGGDTMVSVPQWLNSGKDIVIDLNNPVADSLAVVFGGNTRINLTWRYSDSFSSIVRSIGDATRPTPGIISENIDDITSGVSNYVFGSGATGASLYSGTPHLWVANSLATRTDTIELNNNEGGTIQFQSWGFDRACNSASTTTSVPMGSAWMTTRGGVVYSSGGVNFEIFPLTGHSGFSADAYWLAPFAFYKDEADVTTELVSSSTSSINALLYPTKGTTRSLNHFDVNNRVGYWFDFLKQKSLEQIAGDPSKYVTLNYSANLNTSSTSSALNDGSIACDVNKHCIVNVAGNLGLNSGFVCDAKTTFLVTGTTNIEPDITASGFAQGCIIVSKGDITISDGTYKSGSSTYPKYDIIEAFMISDGKINIPLVDSASSIRDGLLIHGSILGFGTTDGLSINLARSLKPIFNQSYPTVAVHFDNRYLNIATEAFGGDVEGYRREVGFKPY